MQKQKEGGGGRELEVVDEEADILFITWMEKFLVR